MPDRLTSLLQRFELRARVIRGGTLCGVADFVEGDGVGHLHLVRRGPVAFTNRQGQRIVVAEPGVVFYPRPLDHRMDAEALDGAEVVCAAINFGVGDENPLLRGLPDLLMIPLTQAPGLDATLGLLFAEAFGQRCGHAAVVDRLTEIAVVQLLRFAIEQRIVDGGLLAGLADSRLALALNTIHAQPARPWTLDALAKTAGMSRSRFAARFTGVVGLPAGEYLTLWRVNLAKPMLRRGRPVKQVALELGYAGAATFARAFLQTVGVSPAVWSRQQREGSVHAGDRAR